MKKILLLIVSLFLSLAFTKTTQAQCPANLGFELGDLTGWQTYRSTGGNANLGGSIPCALLSVPTLVGTNAQILTNSRVMVANSTTTLYSFRKSLPYSGTDIWSGLPVVCPASCANSYTLKLGDDQVNDSAESVKTQFVVSSGNSTLIYYYASVLEIAIGHGQCGPPRLEFQVSDMGPVGNLYTTPIVNQCASYYQVTPNHGVGPEMPPGWFVSPNITNNDTVLCSPWIPVSVNLSSFVGHVIQLRFTTGDCNGGAHFGYSYIDIPCGCTPFHIYTGYCPGEDTAFLAAPAGFSSYQWINGLDSTVIGFGQNILFPTHDTSQPNIPIWLVVTPINGVGCNDTLYDTLKVVPPPTAAFYHQQYICAHSPIQYFDSSYTQGWGQIIRWQWDFGDNSQFDTTQNPTHMYVAQGNYTVRLVVWSSLSCISDTSWHTVVNVNLPAVNINAGPDVTLCQGGTTQLNGSYFPNQPFVYHWVSTNGLAYPYNGLNYDTVPNPIVNILTTTTYIYSITDTLHSCVFYDTVTVHINGVAPNVMITSNKDTICPGTSAILGIAQAAVNCGSTVVFCNGTPANHQVGSGNTNLSAVTPLNGTYSDGRTQVLFLASELHAASMVAGEINSVTLNITNLVNTTSYYNFNVKMGCTNVTQFTNSSTFVPTTLVSTNVHFLPQAGANTFTFTTPYMWDGVSNLVVEFCFTGGPGNSDLVAQSNTTFSSVLTDYTYGGSGCTMLAGSGWAVPLNYNDRPTLIFNQCSPSNNYTYNWSPAISLNSTTSATPSATPAANTTYTCVVSDALGCSSTVTKAIVVDNTTQLNAGPDTTICNGGICNLHPTASGLLPYSYTWTSTPSGFNSTIPNPIVSPSITTTYTLNFSGLHGCVKTDNVVVTVNPVPTSSFTVSPNPVCTGATVTVTYTGTAPPGSVPLWNWGGGTLLTGGGLGTSTVVYNTAGIVTISLTVTANGCTSTTTTYQLTVNLTPTSTFTVNPNPVCTGANNLAAITYTGTTTAGSTFAWNFVGANITSGLGQGPYQVYWNNGGTKNVSLTVTNANCTSTTTVPVTVNQTPLAAFTASPINACAGQNINLTVNYPAGSILNWFNWDGGTANPGGNSNVNQTVVYSNPGGTKTIKLQVTENGCTSSIDSLNVFITPTPTSTFTVNPGSVCSLNNTAITYTGSGGSNAGFAWTVTGNSNPVNLAGPGPFNINWTYNGNTVQNNTLTLVVSENGCSSTTTQIVPVTPNPTADFTITSPVCAGANALINYIGNNAILGASANFNWNGGIVSSGSGLGQYQVQWANPGNYNVTLQVTQNGCVSAPFVANVQVLPNPIVDAHPDTTICPGSGVGIWASGANSYVWAVNGSTMPATYVYPTSNTVYSVTGTDNNGCKGVGTVQVNLYNPPFVDAGRDTCILRGDSTLIGTTQFVPPGFKYIWTPNLSLRGDSLPQAMAGPPNTTVYTLHVTDKKGCVNADSVVVCITACQEIVMANAFSPNQGGSANAKFVISNKLELIKLLRFDVFNRWGVKVYSSTDLGDAGWDGKFKGVDQELGVYTYFVEGVCQQGSIVRKQGNVTLLR